MNTDINLQVENFREELINYLENSNLPASIVFYVLRDVSRTMEEQYQMILRDSYNKRMKALAEQKAKEEQNKKEEETIKED